MNSPNLREELLKAIISTMEARGSVSRQALNSEAGGPAVGAAWAGATVGALAAWGRGTTLAGLSPKWAVQSSTF